MPTPSRKKREQSLEKRRRSLEIPTPPIKNRHEQLCDGELLPRDLTLDELRLGRGLLENGKTIPGRHRELQQGQKNAITREYHARLMAEFNKHGRDAIETIVEIMQVGEGASAYQGQKDGTGRLKAAQYIIERIVGKIPDKVEVSQNLTVWDGLQEDTALFVDVDIEEINDVQAPEPPARKRGPRTRPTGKAISAD